PPEVAILDFNLQGTVLAVRAYTHTDHYWQVYFDMNEAIARVGKQAAWPVPSAEHKVLQGGGFLPTGRNKKEGICPLFYCKTPTLYREGRTAAAGGGRIRIADNELGAL